MFLSIRAKQVLLFGSYVIACLVIKAVNADELKLAVASNFLTPMKSLVNIYEKETNVKVVISSASTGKLYTQILHGAPYDLFFAANKREPQRLEQNGLAIRGSRTTYAIGKIILWSKKYDISKLDNLANFFSGTSIKVLAIANPKTAPYGVAAMEVLKPYNIPKGSVKIIKGENINQTFQYLASGNADVGFISMSQLNAVNHNGYTRKVPLEHYAAIEQQVVLLAKSDNVIQSKRFLQFLQENRIQSEIYNFGYELPRLNNILSMRQ